MLPSRILKELTPYDWMLLAILLVVSLSGFFFARIISANSSDIIIVEVNGRVVYKLSLLNDTEVKVKGPLGITVIEVKEGKVRVKDSPCPEKICIRQGWTDHGAIVCVPNRVVITIGAEKDRALDAITG